MPLVLVWAKDDIDERVTLELSNNLPKDVADALSCDDPDGKLTADDVEVRFFNINPYDKSLNDIDVVIFANLYPDRQKNFEERKNAIANAIKEILPPGNTVSIWVLVAPGAFSQFVT